MFIVISNTAELSQPWLLNVAEPINLACASKLKHFSIEQWSGLPAVNMTTV